MNLESNTCVSTSDANPEYPNNGHPRGQERTVLFVTHTPVYGGTEKHLLELLARLEDSEVRSLILCTETDPYTDRLTDRYPRVGVRCETALKSVRDWIRIFREIRPEIVVFVYGTLTQLPWYAAAAGRIAGIRKLYAIQHLIPPPVPPKVEGKSIRDVARRLVGRRTRQLLGSRVPPFFCKKTICVSDAVRDSLVRNYRFPARKMITIHNGVSVSEFVPPHGNGIGLRTKLGIDAEEFVLVCVARLGEEKGIDILLQAMSGLLRRNLSCKCIIVGDGHLRENLLEQIRALELGQHVFMVGFQKDVQPYLLASDAFILTSHKEGLPFAVLEAMACGLPCIVTNVGGNAEAVAHNLTGLVVNPGSVDKVVEAVSYLLAHPQERSRMSSLARIRACEKFDIEVKMAEIINTILN
jgi:glycosyltransferase involved in cell wall biosynthesis